MSHNVPTLGDAVEGTDALAAERAGQRLVCDPTAHPFRALAAQPVVTAAHTDVRRAVEAQRTDAGRIHVVAAAAHRAPTERAAGGSKGGARTPRGCRLEGVSNLESATVPGGYQ